MGAEVFIVFELIDKIVRDNFPSLVLVIRVMGNKS